jgi:hypothetical protein
VSLTQPVSSESRGVIHDVKERALQSDQDLGTFSTHSRGARNHRRNL